MKKGISHHIVVLLCVSLVCFLATSRKLTAQRVEDGTGHTTSSDSTGVAEEPLSYAGLLGKAYESFKIGQLHEAEAVARQAKAMNPNRFESYALLGLIEMDRGGYASAKAALSEALQLAEGESEKQIQAFLKQLENEAPSRIASDGYKALGAGKHEIAIEYLLDAWRRDSTLGQAALTAVTALTVKNEVDRAVLLLRTLERSSDTSVANQSQKELSDFKTYINGKYNKYLDSAKLKMEYKDLEQALIALDKAILFDPHRSDAYYTKARFYGTSGMEDLALDNIKRAVYMKVPKPDELFAERDLDILLKNTQYHEFLTHIYGTNISKRFINISEDNTLPIIEIAEPKRPIVKSHVFVFEGKVQDEYLDYLEFQDGTRLSLNDIAQTEGNFSHTMNLKHGENSITVKGADRAGNIGTSNTIIVHYLPDYSPKKIAVESGLRYSSDHTLHGLKNWEPKVGLKNTFWGIYYCFGKDFYEEYESQMMNRIGLQYSVQNGVSVNLDVNEWARVGVGKSLAANVFNTSFTGMVTRYHVPIGVGLIVEFADKRTPTYSISAQMAVGWYFDL